MALEITRFPDDVFIETEEWQRAHQKQGDWQVDQVEVQTRMENHELTISITPTERPIQTIKLRWKHRLEKRLSVLGDHWERAYGDLEWRGIVPERIMPWYFLVHDGSVTRGYGVKTGSAALCYWELDESGVTLTADVRCGNSGVVLNKRILEVARLIQFTAAEDESAFEAARQFCALLCEHPVMPASPVYGGNNWYYAYGDSSYSQIVEDSRFIASLSSSPNRPFMVIDDGWQLSSGGGACNGGPWRGNRLFPDMPGLAAEMRAVGVRPGIWCRPLVATQQVPEHWIRYSLPSGASVLDPSNGDVLHYVAKTIRQLADWGYGLIKHDFTTFDILGRWGFQMKTEPHGLPYAFQDRSKTTAEIILQLYRTIADASGDSIVIGCNTVSHLSAGVFEVQRSGDDTSGKAWERTRYMGINTLAFRMPQHGTFYSHDADCVGITSDIPWELNRSWLELLSASGTPLFVSADPAVITGEQRKALETAFDLAARNRPPAQPLDWQQTTCPSRWLIDGKERRFEWYSSTVDVLGLQDNCWWKSGG